VLEILVMEDLGLEFAIIDIVDEGLFWDFY